METLKLYWKAIVAAIGAVVVAVQAYNSDNVIDPSERVLLVGAFFGAILVYGTSNPTLPFWQYTKFISQVGAGVSAYLAVEWANGPAALTTSQWISLALIGVTALGVLVTPGPKVVTSGSVIEGRTIQPPS